MSFIAWKTCARLWALKQIARLIYILNMPGHSDPDELKRQAYSGPSKEAIVRREQVQEVH